MAEEPDPPAKVAEALPILPDGRRGTTFIRITLPLIALTSLLGSLFIVFPDGYREFLAGFLAYLIPPAGKESVIPALVGAGYPPWLVATYIAGMDMTVAWFLAWNWDLVTRIPKAGDWVEQTMARGEERLRSTPLLDRSAFLGLTLFVYVPFQGSGAVIGIILGRMIGLPPQRAWVAIMLGALLAAFSVAYAAEAYKGAIQLFGLGQVLAATIVVIGAGALTLLVVRRMFRGST